MSGMHLAAEELQQYVLNRAACPVERITHVDACPDCQADVAAYALLMEGLRQQPKPAFDFDVAAVVMERLEMEPGMTTRRGADRPYPYVMAIVIAAVTGIPAWLFWRSAYYVFTDVSAVFLYSILTMAAAILLLRVLHIYKKYQHIINIINK